MPARLLTHGARAEAALTELAKLETSLRSERRRAIKVSDEARRAGQHGNRAYWSGLAEGYRHSADVVAATYEQVRLLYRAG
jgi:hypothetical protein